MCPLASHRVERSQVTGDVGSTYISLSMDSTDNNQEKAKTEHRSNETSGKNMEDEGGSIVRGWEDLDTDILMRICKCFDPLEWLTLGIAQVCRSWRAACYNYVDWKTLDLSVLKSNFIRIPIEPYVYVDRPSDKKLTRILKLWLNLSHGNTESLIFHVHLYVTNDQLTYTAERCPNLRRLVLPGLNRIKNSVLCKAIRIWKDLESFTMPSIENPAHLVKEIANNCRNFRELKIMGPFKKDFAFTLVAFLPKLKVLSLRCSVIDKETLILILDCLRSLEVLNISHCLLILPLPAPERISTALDQIILEKAARLQEFLTCMDPSSCATCQRTRNDEGLMRWYKYEEEMWKADEVRSLAL